MTPAKPRCGAAALTAALLACAASHGNAQQAGTPPQGANAPAASESGPSKAAPTASALVGLTVLSADGNRVGSIEGVDSAPDGTPRAIHIRTGGFLGFGGRLVAIDGGKFTRIGNVVRVHLTAEEVNKLPDFKDET
jgi:hypothetical protein